jgi:hypothetical protein
MGDRNINRFLPGYRHIIDDINDPSTPTGPILHTSSSSHRAQASNQRSEKMHPGTRCAHHNSVFVSWDHGLLKIDAKSILSIVLVRVRSDNI